MTDDWKPDRDLQERADAWFSTKFFKKGGIGDNDWKPLVAACKTWGMPKDVKWRDWLKEQWESARANAVRVLVTAKAIQAPAEPKQLIGGNDGTILAYLEENVDRDFTIDDLVAGVKPLTGGAFKPAELQKHLDSLLDAGLVYQPLINRYKAIKGAK